MGATALGARLGLAWLEGSGPQAEVVVSTRVRLARNLQGSPFVSRAGASGRMAVLDRVSEAVAEAPMLQGATVLGLPSVPVRQRRMLHERRVVSRELLGAENEPPAGTAAVASDGCGVSLMVNEEDHLRLQSLAPGLQLAEAWRRADRLDDEIGAALPLAYHNEFGFLTACPTNAGTGLRASVLVHLPGLVLTKEIEKVLRAVSQMGLTFRGLHGEGSDVVGNFFQISNQTTLGRSEEDLVSHVARKVDDVIQAEVQAREVLLRDARAAMEDKVWRAYGLLRHARCLRYEELVNLLSGVRLGVALKLLPDPPLGLINTLMILAQPAHVDEASGRDLPAGERQGLRARYVRARLASAHRAHEDARRAGGDARGKEAAKGDGASG